MPITRTQARSVTCPACGAKAGAKCFSVSSTGRQYQRNACHAERWAAYRAARPATGGTTLTVRDRFAAAALQGDWAAQDSEMNGIYLDDTTDDVLYARAKLYYRMADAMLRARVVPTT